MSLLVRSQFKASARKIAILLGGIAISNVAIGVASIIEVRRLRSLSDPDNADSTSRLALFSANLALAYTLGLRHALDADHIAAIDNVTRRLFARYPSQPPVSVGFWFSLGHSSVVVTATIALIAIVSAAFRNGDQVPTEDEVQERLDGFARIGGIIGTSMSMTFLLVIAIANVFTLMDLRKERLSKESGTEAETDGTLAHSSDDKETSPAPESNVTEKLKTEQPSNSGPRGLMSLLLKSVISAVDRPWRMYPVGVLFGLGFDTALGVIVLAIAGIQASSPTSSLLLPLLFTCGMVLADTLDGILMLSAFSWASANKDRRWKYNVFITLVGLLIALLVSIFQTLNLASTLLGDSATGPFWETLGSIESEWIGVAIVGVFLLSWAVAWALSTGSEQTAGAGKQTLQTSRETKTVAMESQVVEVEVRDPDASQPCSE
ncbi:hypothetical protein HDU93_007255 [Gonapodya sp. JEL0774]|nr:hypothetical protein HDU93_007255 [Gonapodya sp. JEL0774]